MAVAAVLHGVAARIIQFMDEAVGPSFLDGQGRGDVVKSSGLLLNRKGL